MLCCDLPSSAARSSPIAQIPADDWTIVGCGRGENRVFGLILTLIIKELSLPESLALHMGGNGYQPSYCHITITLQR